MANAHGRRPTSVVTGPRRTPIEKLELIYALLTGDDKITPSLLRVRLLAICEGRLIPTDRKAFIALAARAGVSQSKCYTAWREWRGELPDTAAVIPLRGSDDVPADDQAPETALYRWWDEADLLLYIGISDELSGRTGSHIKGSSWMEFAARSTIARYPTRPEAKEAEIVAIKREGPIFNKQHNDTPEARRRAVEYLLEHDRLDLLAPLMSRG